MDYLFLEKLSKEINSALKGKRIKSIYSEGKKVTLDFGKFFLNFYFGVPNAAFLSNTPITEKPLYRLSKLAGSFVKEATLPVKDRVLEIRLVSVDYSGKKDESSLIAELTGKHANLIYLDENRKVKFLLRQVISSTRPIELGEPYKFPPEERKEFEELKFGQVSPEGIEKKLYKFVKGLSPLNSKEIAAIYRETGSLKKAYEIFLKKHTESSSAFLYYKEEKPTYMTTFPYQSLSNLNARKFNGNLPFSNCWRTFYEEKVEKEEKEELKRKALLKLRNRLETLKLKLKKLASKEELEKQAEIERMRGELLKYNLSAVKPGAKAVRLYNYYTGKEEEIPIDPSISPKENAEKYFKAYKKLKRKAEKVEELKGKLEEEIEQVETLIEAAISGKALEELLPPVSKEKSTKHTEKDFPFFTVTLPSGKKLIIGKNSRGNELVSLKLANPWDIWFHAKEIPGSHVLLRLKKGEKASEEDILTAASAAAYFSKARESGKVPVDYTEAKNLRKPSGTPAGLVIYKKEKTIYVSPQMFKEVMEKGRRKAPRN